MVRKQILKRVSYFGVALMLMLASVPILPSGSAWADGGLSTCIGGPWNNLNNKLSSTADELEITLCAGEDYSEYDHGLSAPNIKNLVLDLNGNAIRITGTNVKPGNSLTIKNGTILGKNGNPLFSNSGTLTFQNVTYSANDLRFVRNNAGGVLRIVSGNYSGATTLFYGDGAANISGGTFDRDVNSGVASGYAAYKSGNAWVVETKLTNENITAPDTIVLKEGEVFDVASIIGLPAGSTTGLSYYSRNNDVANINYRGINSEGSNGLLGVSAGTTSIAVRPLYDTSLIKNINVVVESGLVGIDVDDLNMSQEDSVRTRISNIYAERANPDYVTGVTYVVDRNNLPSGLAARISTAGDELVVTTGIDAKIEPGTYTVRIKALRDGVDTGIYRDVTVNVGNIFTNFSLNQQLASENTIELKENESVELTVKNARTMNSADNVEVVSVELRSASDVMSTDGVKTISGSQNGIGEATIYVTAEYTSSNNHKYTFTKGFKVKVLSVLESIGVRDINDDNYSGDLYGSDAGETSEVELDKYDEKSFKITKHWYNAATDYAVEIVSGNDVVELDDTNITNGQFGVSGKMPGVATVRVSVTPKGGNDTLTKEFNIKVNPILEDITIAVESDGRVMTEDYEIDNGDFGRIIATANDNLDATGDITYTFAETDRVKRLDTREDGNFRSGLNTKSEATVRVTARDSKGREVTKDIKIKINPVLVSLALENDDITIYEEDTAQIKIKQVVADVIKSKVAWSYENYDGSIISVSETGEVTGLKDGTTVVKVVGTFVSPLGKTYTASKEARITVKPLLKQVSIKSKNGRYLLSGTTQTLYELDNATYRISHKNKNAPVTYTAISADEDVATVVVNGSELEVITYEKVGSTLITVIAEDNETGKKVSTTMTIKVKPTLKNVSADDVYMVVGEKEALNVSWENPDVTPSLQYHSGDRTIARVSPRGNVTGMKAGETTATVRAYYDSKVAEATAGVHVYEMVKPVRHHYYGAVGQVFNVHVGDKNTNAYTRARVNAPWGMFVMGDAVMALLPGVYTVIYTDYMANGEVVGEYAAEFTIFNVERETVVVARGDTVELEPHSEWNTTSAKDETTGHHVRVNRDGKVVFKADEATALGVHDITMKHMFRYDVREVVKEVRVVVYDVVADLETDPDGVTADTLKEYIEGMFVQPTSWEEFVERMQQTRGLFGDGFEYFWSTMGVSSAVFNGDEINTRVEVTELEEEEVEVELIDAIGDLDVKGVKYFDVSVWMSKNGYDFGKIHQLNGKITVALTEVADPETGYIRQYIVVREHDGEIEMLEEGVDFYIEDGVLYIISDKFSTYAVAYQDTLIPAYGGVAYTVSAPDTGVNTKVDGGATSTNMVVAVLAALTATALAGVAMFAKRR